MQTTVVDRSITVALARSTSSCATALHCTPTPLEFCCVVLAALFALSAGYIKVASAITAAANSSSSKSASSAAKASPAAAANGTVPAGPAQASLAGAQAANSSTISAGSRLATLPAAAPAASELVSPPPLPETQGNISSSTCTTAAAQTAAPLTVPATTGQPHDAAADHSSSPTAAVAAAAGNLFVAEPGGLCGPSSGRSCSGGECCSSRGWCGMTQGHCAGSACMPGYGRCDPGGPTQPANPGSKGPREQNQK